MAGADPAERVHARIVGDPVELPGGDLLVQEFDAHIRYLADGSMALDTTRSTEPLPPLAVGTPLKMSRAVVGDATYIWDAHVTEILNPRTGSVRLSIGGVPQRTQQRDHVRVTTGAVPVTLTLVPADDGAPDGVAADGGHADDGAADGGAAADGAGDGGATAPCPAVMHDVSAGGTRVTLVPMATDRSFAVGDVLHLDVTLGQGDHALELDIDAQVRWAAEFEGQQVLGLMFVGVDRRMTTTLTRWVFAEEALQSRRMRR